ncbi:histone H3-like centromeric protein A isoform X1 [Hyla sarda]|uniref:histone H3-like centromeric protein A isoform X1 n=1 Tax=Hyla sarda TaxID=327740 RepID=UPI0024C2E093|nr:histone H3-like centromeric protein A isoform X1 [Hyla sarda]XP_056395385.1 histone H3-like centromeric protein A isoform X1 [Hyla sarda]
MKTQKTSSRKSKQPVKRPLGILHPPKTKGTRTTWHRKSMEQRRRFTPRARALMEESECQELINLYKSKFPIMELLIEVLLDCCKDRIRFWQSKAVECLYEVSEVFVTRILQLLTCPVCSTRGTPSQQKTNSMQGDSEESQNERNNTG